MIKQLLILILFFSIFNLYGQQQTFPREVNLVFDYLINKDYPELFNDKTYQFRPVSWQIVDIDDDGVTEVFLQTYPHYKQSPSITIFKVSKDDSVKRIIEGLAPGHLIPISKEDDYFTPHSTGTAIDMQIESSDNFKLMKFAEASLKFGMSCVIYGNFIHTDKREGKFFLDLTYLNDYADENSCANFQFSKPEIIVAGKIKESANKYFIAKSNNELFCYEILGFKDDTFINKNVKIIKAPANLVKFVISDGYIKYTIPTGEIIDLQL